MPNSFSAGTHITQHGPVQGIVIVDPVTGLPVATVDDAGVQRLAVDASTTVTVVNTNGSVGATGAAPPADATLVGGVGSGGNLEPLNLDSSGNLKISGTIAITDPSVGTPGSAAPSQATQIGGSDGTDLRVVKVSATGVVSVDGSSVTQPTSITQGGNTAVVSSGGGLVVSGLSAVGTSPANNPVSVSGVDGGGLKRALLTDTTGKLQVGVTTNVPASNISTTGTITATNAPLLISTNGLSSVSVEITGTWSGSLSVQGTDDSVNFTNFLTASGGSGLFSTTAITTNGRYRVFRTSATKQVQIVATAWTSGTATITIEGSSGISIVEVVQQNASNNVGQSNTFDGAGNSIGSTSGALNVAAVTAGSSGVSNAPVYYQYSTPITTSAYTQLIASTTSTTNYLDIFDSSGQAMILATGASGLEVVLAYVPPGGDQIKVQIPSGTRVAYKALTANATTNYLLMNLWK